MPKVIPQHKKTRFRKYLDRNKISVAFLTYKSGLAYSTIYKIVQGYSHGTSMFTIRKLLRALNCKFEDIFDV